MDSTAAMRLPTVLSAFHRDHPELALELSSGTTNDLTARVISSELDAALIADVHMCGETRIEFMHAFDETLVIVAENGHARIRSPHDVNRRTLLAFGQGCAYRQRLYDWFTRCGIMPDRIVDLGSYHAILGSIAAGMGVALLPEQLLRFTTYSDLLSVHPIESDQAPSVTSLIWRRGDERNTALNAFVKTLSQVKEPRI